MNLTKKVFHNFSYIFLARTLFRVLMALSMVYAARYLGVDRYGMFETATAWANTFLALNDVGMSTLIVREAARDEKKMAVYFGNTLLVEAVLSVFLLGLILSIGALLKYNDTTLLLMFILGAAGLVFEFRKVMRGIFRVLMKLKFVAVLEVVNGLLYLLFTIWIFAAVTDKDLGLIGLAHSRLWVDVLIVVVLFLYTIRFVRPRFAPREIWPMIKQSYTFTLYNVFFMLYFQIDQIILSIMKTPADVGIYSAPAKIVTVFLFIPIMLFQVTMPVMYRYSKDNMEKYKRINNAKMRYLAAFGIPAGVGLWFLAPEIIQLVYNDAYAASVPVLAVFGWFMAIRFTGISQGNSMTTTDREGQRAVIQIISLVINAVLDVILIAKYGPVGAAVATLITELCITGSYFYFSARHLQESAWHNIFSLWPVALSTAAMVGALVLIKPHVHVIVAVIFGAILYPVFLWIFRFFRPYDRQLLNQIIKKEV